MVEQRGAATARILHELIVVSRRGIIRAGAIESLAGGPALTEAEQTIVAYLAEHPSIRSTDLAAAFSLNRSTVSRQLDRLVELGLVRQIPDASGRGRPLELTPAGRAGYEHTIAQLHAEITEQMRSWTDTEVDGFAAALLRFNQTNVPDAEPGREPQRKA